MFNELALFIKVFQPKKFDGRVISQKSWFSIQNMMIFEKTGGDGPPIFDNYNIINQMSRLEYHLIRIKIPNKNRLDILKGLRGKEINQNSIFPDLKQGNSELSDLCKEIKNKEF